MHGQEPEGAEEHLDPVASVSLTYFGVEFTSTWEDLFAFTS